MSNFKFGKLAHRHDERTFLFSKYSAALPVPPAALKNTDRIFKTFGSSDPAKIFPMDGNDQYGCCTMAAGAHIETAWNAYAGKQTIAAAADVVKQYLKMTGGKDTGLVELDVLNYWRKYGLFGEKILGFAKVDPKNHVHVKQVMQYFGGVYLGFTVQANCIKEFDAGKPWTPGKLTEDGHAVDALDYDPNYVTLLTWGNVQKGTWAWWDETVDEAWAIIPTVEVPGFDYATLKADLAAVSN